MKTRLFALDLLRGFDIFSLTVVAVLVEAFHAWHPIPGIIQQFRHPAWTGICLYDIIMPLFIFMCGAALPLALPRRLTADGRAGWLYWRHVLGRVAWLWFLGMIAQGELLTFDLHRISFFNNTLQTIACGYLAVALVCRIPSRLVRIAVPFVLAALYTAWLHLAGDLTPTGNAAVIAETKFLLLFYPDASWHPVKQIAAWGYTWWATIPMFAVMGLAGYQATEILQSPLAPRARMFRLATVGVGLLALGGALATFDPIVKKIYTASFTSLAMGVCFILYAAAYGLGDIVGWRRGTGLLILFGRHSLFAYMLSGAFAVVLKSIGFLFLCGPKMQYPNGLSRFFSEPFFAFVFQVLLAVLLCVAVKLRDNLSSLNPRQQR